MRRSVLGLKVLGMLALGLLAMVLLAPPPALAASTGADPGVTLTPAQAVDALDMLQDPHRRAQLEDTLRAIAAAGALGTPPAAPAVAPATAPASNAAPAAAAPATIRPNGLVSEIVRQGAASAVQTGLSLRRSIAALLDVSSLREWLGGLQRSPQGRAAAGRLAWTLCCVLVPALAVAWLTHRVLGRARAHSIVVAPSTEPPVASGAALHRLPRVALNLVLNLVPLAVFVVVAILMMTVLTEAGVQPERSLDALLDIVVIGRATVIISAFVLQPNDAALRLVRIEDGWARFAQHWIASIASVVVVGTALAQCALALGLAEQAYLALMKVVALIAHVLIAILILQCRQPVASRIRARVAGRPSLRLLGGFVADAWALVAVFIIMALWFVWALDVRNGYRVLVHLGGSSIAILILARLVSMVVFGALARAFHTPQDQAQGSLWARHAYRYYPLVRGVLSTIIAFATVLLLLQLWGAHVEDWFKSGSVPHQLTSTIVTIAVAVAIGLFVWEAVNVALERRLDRWSKANDLARAARLRTLAPMLRGALVLAIAPVVLLTALSDLGVNIAPLVAGASIFGVALGFGSQKLVQDFITGIFLLMDNAMQVGDWVTVAGVSGTVEHLSIRTVRLRGGDGSVYTVPFSSVSTVNNTNRGIGNAAVKVNVAYGQDIDLAIATLKEIGSALRQDPEFKDGILSDFSFWGVDQLDGAAVTLSGQVECLDSARWGVQREFNRRILDLFRARGIEIANPQRSVMVPSAAPLKGALSRTAS